MTELDAERWRLVDRLFAEALELAPEDRARFLDRECAGDDELRREVGALLDSDRDDGFLEAGVGTEAARVIAADARRSLVGQRVGRFEVEARLGAGGMGEVYRGRDPRLNRQVALKVLPAHLTGEPEHEARFRREALAASAANHPNIVTVHEIVELEGRDLLVTELVEGVTLRQRLADGPLPVARALEIALQIARGLEAAHAMKVVHRDVKPENVMIRDDGLVKVLDFGIARLPPGSQPADGTAPGAIFGTAAYMSPEQARGLPVDARTDVWSLGVILWEMLVGEAPYRRTTPSDTLAAILLEDPPPPSHHRREVPPELDRVVARALAKERDERTPEAATLVQELETLLARTGSRPADEPEPVRQLRGRRLRARITSLGAAALILTTVAFVGWRLAGAPGGAAIDSIAVLPLENVGGDPAGDYLSDGVTESLIRGLAQAENLRVISRDAAFRYKGRQLPAREVGRALGVRGVLTGRLEERGDWLGVSVELIDARDDSHLWGESYELPMDELSSLHQSIAADLHHRLRRRLTGEQRARLARLHTDDAEAYRLYLEGRFHWYQTAAAEYHQSRDYFVRAIERDPDYALAWAGLGHYYGFGAAAGLLAPDEYWPRTEQAARRVRELDPDLPEAFPLHAALTLYWRRDWIAGERELRASTGVFPEALNHHSAVLGLLGRVDEALRVRELDLRRDPTSLRANRQLGVTLYFAHRYPEAAAQLRRTLELYSTDVPAWEQLGDTLLELGRGAEAVAAWRQALVHSGKGELAARLQSAFESAGLEAAIRTLGRARLDALKARAASGEYVPAYELARQSLRAGEREEGLAWALQAFGERNRLVLDLVNDPVFDPLRDDPDLREAVRALGLPPREGGPPSE
ncbi:MAG TPA: protein kinase [Thermoanaerobaculia bacterium]|nr:protein kinase [Thermoanaerobaculia bacterium]